MPIWGHEESMTVIGGRIASRSGFVLGDRVESGRTSRTMRGVETRMIQPWYYYLLCTRAFLIERHKGTWSDECGLLILGLLGGK